MPELPEVETIRREITPYLKGRTIKKVELLDPRNIKGIAPKIFAQKLVGRKILEIERKAKYLIFKLTAGKYLVVHLGLTGRLLKKSDPYVKLIFELDAGRKLYYSDARLFGKLQLLDHYPQLKLGPEPLAKEFTFEKFKNLFQKRKGIIKVLLLDQKLMAGVGNIYAIESLFRAKIHPQRKAETLTEKELKALYVAIREVLQAAIRYRGTSADWYVDAEGKKGGFQLKLKVYDREGKPCLRCKTPIQRISLAQRGTYFCPRCQR